MAFNPITDLKPGDMIRIEAIRHDLVAFYAFIEEIWETDEFDEGNEYTEGLLNVLNFMAMHIATQGYPVPSGIYSAKQMYG